MSEAGWTVLCAADEVEEGGARGFLLGAGPAREDVVLVREGGCLFAYRNRCPHQGTPLEIFPDRFRDPATGLLVCTTHGARFRPADGVCVSGPCLGKRLAALALREREGAVEVRLASRTF